MYQINQLGVKIIMTSFAIVFYAFLLHSQVSREISVEVSDGTLFGTLYVADTLHPTPVVLVIGGSGPVDRNMSPDNSYQMLADSLVAHGISVLATDKRTAGKSKQHISGLENTRFDDFVNDAAAWTQQLLDNPNFSKVYLMGHSQGSLIAILVAQKIKNVTGVISVAGAGQRIQHILRKQLYDPPINKMLLESFVEPIIDSMEHGVVTDSVHVMIKSIFRPELQPFWMSWMAYNPADEISKLDIPCLIINGDADFQVDTTEAEKLYLADTSNLLKVIPHMNHMMKYSSTINKAQCIKESYNRSELPIMSELVMELIKFIRKE